MNLKFKVGFYNLMIFLIIFDIIYFTVWMLSIQMNLVKALIVIAFAALLTPWARMSDPDSGRKVMIRSYAFVMYNKYIKHRTI